LTTDRLVDVGHIKRFVAPFAGAFPSGLSRPPVAACFGVEFCRTRRDKRNRARTRNEFKIFHARKLRLGG